MPETKLIATLRTLYEGRVQFIVVGGLAAVLNGAPIQTYDIDLVYSLESTNVDRLLTLLHLLDAFFRIQPERRLKPNATHFIRGGHLNLLTRYGPLDLLGTIGRNLGYDELLPHSSEMDIGEGVRIRVLNLETLVEVKEQLAAEKDLGVLPILRQTLKQIRKKG